tara:strand:- start:18130 stop:18729 length:600 start_codon:yes stop_codon:yes gene_type:complete
MKSDKLILLIILILIALNIFWPINYMKLKQHEQLQNSQFQLQNNSLNNELDFHKKLLTLTSFTTVLNQSAANRLNAKYPNFNSQQGFEKLIAFKFSENSCTTCILKIFQDLEILSDVIGQEKIIIFAPNPSFLNRYIDITTSMYKIIYIESLSLPQEQLNQPFLFMIHKNYYLSNFFFPDITSEETENYLGNLRHLFRK